VDQKGERWVGEHRPELADLTRLFVHLAEIDVKQIEAGGIAALEAWRNVLPEGILFVRMLSTRCIHVHLPNAPVIQHAVVKLVTPKAATGLRRLTEPVERSRSHRSHLWAHRLRALGIETPRPLGYVEHEKRPARNVSFASFEHVGAPTLMDIRDGRLSLLSTLGPGAIAEKRALIVRVARLLAKLHANDLFHGDLHPANILVDKDRLLVVDLESMRSVSFPGRAAVKNLVRLNRDFLDTRLITRTDRLRFLSTYVEHRADRETLLRLLWNRVRFATEQKLVERGQAFTPAP
jgi:tRNA A-37 threonylcarbamoyl transferase component Bud32